MQKIVLDSALKNRFAGFDERTELCDEAGQLIGYFVPAEAGPPLDYDVARASFSDEELELARGQPGGRTTAEVLERLKNL